MGRGRRFRKGMDKNSGKVNERTVYRQRQSGNTLAGEGRFPRTVLPFSLKSGPTSSLSGGQINFNGNNPYGDGKKGNSLARTAPCGSFAEAVNAFGLYDMHGNVSEWCADWYGDYPTGRVLNPSGSENGSFRVRRGGSWDHVASNCRAANRGGPAPVGPWPSIGFRLVRVPPLDENLPKPAADAPWVVFEGGDGPGKGKHIVLVSGEQEYRSEESLP